MEYSFLNQTEVANDLATVEKNLRLIRRMQAVTIELCMAQIEIFFSDLQHVDLKSFKSRLSRVCGLTEEDFRRKEDGTQKAESKEKPDSRSIVGFSRGDSIHRESAD